jgi:hypothetical protein
LRTASLHLNAHLARTCRFAPASAPFWGLVIALTPIAVTSTGPSDKVRAGERWRHFGGGQGRNQQLDWDAPEVAGVSNLASSCVAVATRQAQPRLRARHAHIRSLARPPPAHARSFAHSPTHTLAHPNTHTLTRSLAHSLPLLLITRTLVCALVLQGLRVTSIKIDPYLNIGATPPSPTSALVHLLSRSRAPSPPLPLLLRQLPLLPMYCRHHHVQ